MSMTDALALIRFRLKPASHLGFFLLIAIEPEEIPISQAFLTPIALMSRCQLLVARSIVSMFVVFILFRLVDSVSSDQMLSIYFASGFVRSKRTISISRSISLILLAVLKVIFYILYKKLPLSHHQQL